MVAAAGMPFNKGLGAIAGLLMLGWMMSLMGPGGFVFCIAILMVAMVIYAIYRMTRRAAPQAPTPDVLAPVTRSAAPVAVEFAQEIAIEAAQSGKRA
jgi:Na+-transporting methylmalonyl-CoA/oxaloacetate decarboxylase gamma subunit